MKHILTTLALATILGSTFLTAFSFQPQKYINIINKTDDAYEDTLNDLCDMMEIAEKFRDDPDYNYDPSDMERIVMRDGVNGTQEMIDVFNELMNVTESDVDTDFIYR